MKLSVVMGGAALGVFALAGCPDGEDFKFGCECWDPDNPFFNVGTPEKCAEDREEAVGSAKAECSEEIGKPCQCTCDEDRGMCDAGEDS